MNATSDQTDGSAIAAMLATLARDVAALTRDISDIKADQRRSADEASSQRDTLTRIDERQNVWATRQEVSEAVAVVREMLIPVQSQAKAAHNRLDGFDLDITEIKQIMDSVKSSHTTEVGDVEEKIEKRLAEIETSITNLRLSWSRATGIAVGAGAIGGGLSQVLRLLGG